MNDGLQLIGRWLMAVIFIVAGFGKLMAPAATQAMMAKYGLPMPMIAYGVTVAVELGGGLLLFVGLWTRPVAIVLAIWCVATAMVAHTNFGDPGQRAHFMKNIAMAGGFLYVYVLGAGMHSLDRLRAKRAGG
ncbi:MAG TPA: DoxX family protein [Reyranella sp.]|nr:DoxX family protein [Reyranella sp.]